MSFLRNLDEAAQAAAELNLNLTLTDYFRNYFSSILTIFLILRPYCNLGGFFLNDGLRFPSTLECFFLPIDEPPLDLLGAP